MEGKTPFFNNPALYFKHSKEKLTSPIFPNEIFGHIFNYCEESTLITLKTTCRDLYAEASYQFVERIFEQKDPSHKEAQEAILFSWLLNMNILRRNKQYYVKKIEQYIRARSDNLIDQALGHAALKQLDPHHPKNIMLEYLKKNQICLRILEVAEIIGGRTQDLYSLFNELFLKVIHDDIAVQEIIFKIAAQSDLTKHQLEELLNQTAIEILDEKEKSSFLIGSGYLLFYLPDLDRESNNSPRINFQQQAIQWLEGKLAAHDFCYEDFLFLHKASRFLIKNEKTSAVIETLLNELKNPKEESISLLFNIWKNFSSELSTHQIQQAVNLLKTWPEQGHFASEALYSIFSQWWRFIFFEQLNPDEQKTIFEEVIQSRNSKSFLLSGMLLSPSWEKETLKKMIIQAQSKLEENSKRSIWAIKTIIQSVNLFPKETCLFLLRNFRTIGGKGDTDNEKAISEIYIETLQKMTLSQKLSCMDFLIDSVDQYTENGNQRIFIGSINALEDLPAHMNREQRHKILNCFLQHAENEYIDVRIATITGLNYLSPYLNDMELISKIINICIHHAQEENEKLHHTAIQGISCYAEKLNSESKEQEDIHHLFSDYLARSTPGLT